MGVLSTNRSQIVSGGLISASFVSDIYDVLTGNVLDAVQISGSLNVTGSIIGTITTASYATTAVSAISASYASSYVETDPIFVAKSGSYATTGSNTFTTTQTISSSSIVLRQVSASLNFVNDSEAAAGGVPLGGLYRSGSFILIRLS
jgi:hypothetical protein